LGFFGVKKKVSAGLNFLFGVLVCGGGGGGGRWVINLPAICCFCLFLFCTYT